MILLAALFVQPKGAYANPALAPYVDLWPESRDARLYAGPWPVVAHPPCSRWCALASVVEARWGHKRGEDGGCFASALASVCEFGGVLEHPAFSKAWPAFGLTRPRAGCWTRNEFGGWVCQVSQSAYGCAARKRTWLYCSHDRKPMDLDWRDLRGVAVVGLCNNRARFHDDKRKRLSPKEASATPPAFRDALISIALELEAT